MKTTLQLIKEITWFDLVNKLKNILASLDSKKTFLTSGTNVAVVGEGTEEVPYVISSYGGGGGGESSVLQTKVTVTPSQMLDLLANPVELIPAPGAGRVINLIKASIFLDYGTTPYDFNDNVQIWYPSSPAYSYFYINQTEINANADTYMAALEGSLMQVNEPLILEANVDATQGDSPVTIIVTYTIDNFN